MCLMNNVYKLKRNWNQNQMQKKVVGELSGKSLQQLCWISQSYFVEFVL